MGPASAAYTPSWHCDAELLGFGERDFAIGLPVGLGHIWEARAEALVVRANERIDALKIDVIADDHERALLVLQIDSAGGVGQNRGADAEPAQDAHGERDLLRGVAFVEMDAALHRGDGDIPDFADYQAAGVADRQWNAGNREFFRRECAWRRLVRRRRHRGRSLAPARFSGAAWFSRE